MATAYQHLIGKTLAGRFELLECVGSGGMSVVFKALHRDLNQIVCIKVLRSELIAGSTGLRRLQTEAKALAALEHPNILRSIAMDASDQCTFLATEYIEGETLAHILRSTGALATDRIRALFMQFASALAYAHSQGIIHRDLKPSNIMLTRVDGAEHAKILDFGIAKIVDNAEWQRLTKSGMLIGTPQYMAPEQCSEGICDARTDIYSLGCILYECLTGTPPFSGDSSMEVMLKHLHHAPQMVPGPFGAIAAKAMSKDPAQRFQSAQELLDALQRDTFDFLPPPSAKSPTGATSKRAPASTLLPIVGIVAFVLIGIAACIAISQYFAKSETDRLVLPPHDINAKLPPQRPTAHAALRDLEEFRNLGRDDALFRADVEALLNLRDQLTAYEYSEVCEAKGRLVQQDEPVGGGRLSERAKEWYTAALAANGAEGRYNAWPAWELIWMNDYLDYFERSLSLYQQEHAKVIAKDAEISRSDSKEAEAILADGLAGICTDDPNKQHVVEEFFQIVEKNREGHPHDQLRAVFDRFLNKTRSHPVRPTFQEAVNTLAKWKAAHPQLAPLLETRYELYKTELEMRRDLNGRPLLDLEARIIAKLKEGQSLQADVPGYEDLLEHLLIAKGEMMMIEGRLKEAEALFKTGTAQMRRRNDKKSLRRIRSDQKLLSGMQAHRRQEHSATEAGP